MDPRRSGLFGEMKIVCPPSTLTPAPRSSSRYIRLQYKVRVAGAKHSLPSSAACVELNPTHIIEKTWALITG
jgi:hypothetical protein